MDGGRGCCSWDGRIQVRTCGDHAMSTPAVAPLSNGVKYLSMGAGIAGGLGMGVAAHYALPSPETERTLEQQGISTYSDREARATFGPMAMFFAAAIGAGIGKRSESAALTTASLGAAAMMASPAATGMTNAESPDADKNLRTMGVLGGVAAAGFAIGAVDEVPLNRAKVLGLGAMGLAIGTLLPETAKYVGSMPGDFVRSVQHRNG